MSLYSSSCLLRSKDVKCKKHYRIHRNALNKVRPHEPLRCKYQIFLLLLLYVPFVNWYNSKWNEISGFALDLGLNAQLFVVAKLFLSEILKVFSQFKFMWNSLIQGRYLIWIINLLVYLLVIRFIYALQHFLLLAWYYLGCTHFPVYFLNEYCHSSLAAVLVQMFKISGYTFPDPAVLLCIELSCLDIRCRRGINHYPSLSHHFPLSQSAGNTDVCLRSRLFPPFFSF